MSSEPAGSLEEISRCLSLNQDTARLCAVEFGQRSLTENQVVAKSARFTGGKGLPQ